ncbi:MAG: hypothetical protein E7360_06960 [Clostridiales bacterium]|nr:hypothetical protein [Clostridiales bacterium]
MRKVTRRINIVLLSFVIALTVWVAGNSPATFIVRAGVEVNPFETSSVVSDLENSVIDGEPFELKDYTFTNTKKTQVITFLEYYYSKTSTSYELYVYVYNPQKRNFVVDSTSNKISINFGYESRYDKYPLRFIDFSTEKGYERMFYKFAVSLTQSQRDKILKSISEEERTYNVSGIELIHEGAVNTIEYPVAKRYKYSGLAPEGNQSGTNTLKFKSQSIETLNLDVHPTVFRPDGVKGLQALDNYTQESLHSVYFAVPNSVLNKYGKMSKIHATWLDAVLKPTIITSNLEVYNEFYPFLGQYIGSLDKAFDYCIVGDYHLITAHREQGSFAYNRPIDGFEAPYKEQIDTLYMLIYNGSGTDTWEYTLPSERLQTEMRKSANIIGGNLICGKYSKDIFQSVDTKYTDIVIDSEDKYSLSSLQIDLNFWRLFFTGTLIQTNTFDGIKAIYPVKKSDLNGTVEEVCERLFISKGDYNQFVEYFNANSGENTIYLFRYQVSDYVSQKATTLEYKPILGINRWDYPKNDSYIFYEKVNLDFDIIDITFTSGLNDTVIPVVADPIDVIPSPTPPQEIIKPIDPFAPIENVEDTKFGKFMSVVLVLLAVFVVIKIASGIIKRNRKEKDNEKDFT